MQLHHRPPAALFFVCSSPFASGVMAGSNFVIFSISRRAICNDFWGGNECIFDNRISQAMIHIYYSTQIHRVKSDGGNNSVTQFFEVAREEKRNVQCSSDGCSDGG
jgi:hypothetical protein